MCRRTSISAKRPHSGSHHWIGNFSCSFSQLSSQISKLTTQIFGQSSQKPVWSSSTTTPTAQQHQMFLETHTREPKTKQPSIMPAMKAPNQDRQGINDHAFNDVRTPFRVFNFYGFGHHYKRLILQAVKPFLLQTPSRIGSRAVEQ
ncbi:hypothetical protein Nepgr_014385 [Nepenthes gracilis]|uniref:Uncharacterized protein n=1 Tax=Nepenthes gracilis TaxID=150966 RepID=A0AAD3SKS0_NEPGR|nr:hypothetical protein Nepgr_014385 [Nepenthes gracilis]